MLINYTVVKSMRYILFFFILNIDVNEVLALLCFCIIFFLSDIFLITFQMLSPFLGSSPLYPPPALLLSLLTATSWPWCSRVLGHIIFTRPRASQPSDGRLGHPLLNMQLETELWGGGGTGQFILFLLYSCRPLQLLGYFLQLLYQGPCVPSN